MPPAMVPAGLPTSASYLPDLLDVMEAGLDRTEPSANMVSRAAGESLFGGSYDWHSCIFAHWALLTQARRDGDVERAARILERLSDEALAGERARLAEAGLGGRLTYSYGQCWLLRLLAELERHRAVAPSTRAFREETERALLEVLDQAPFPELEGDRRLEGRGVIGYYSSWAFTWYQVMAAGPVTEGAGARLTRMREERLDPWREQLVTPVDPRSFEFLWVPTLGYLVDSVEPFDPPLAPYVLDRREVLPAEVTMRTTHLLGVHASRLWPLALRAAEDPAAAAELDRALAELLGRRELWDGDFAVVSHWMPQFIWLNFYLAGVASP
ncbi:MAG: DUF2891 family protein [Planctomycetes bacterium]|nr:DUF2891 family protein [Planctomycetota bacterium]